MEREDQDLIKEFLAVYRRGKTAQEKHRNLLEIKDEISKERFESLAKEYKRVVEQAHTEISQLKRSIVSRLETLTGEFEVTQERLNSVNESIEQEKKLYEARAISKQEHVAKIEPLKEEQKELNSELNKKRNQIDFLKKAVSDPGASLPETQGVKERIGRVGIPKGKTFNEDFKTGCLTFILVGAIIFVGIPLLIFTFKIGAFLAIPIVFVLAFIVFLAFFGRIINFLRAIWHKPG